MTSFFSSADKGLPAAGGVMGTAASPTPSARLPGLEQGVDTRLAPLENKVRAGQTGNVRQPRAYSEGHAVGDCISY